MDEFAPIIGVQAADPNEGVNLGFADCSVQLLINDERKSSLHWTVASGVQLDQLRRQDFDDGCSEVTPAPQVGDEAHLNSCAYGRLVLFVRINNLGLALEQLPEVDEFTGAAPFSEPATVALNPFLSADQLGQLASLIARL